MFLSYWLPVLCSFLLCRLGIRIYCSSYQFNSFFTVVIDINECSNNNGGCSHFCVNTQGSYHCECPDDYILLPDGHKCAIEGESHI